MQYTAMTAKNSNKQTNIHFGIGTVRASQISQLEFRDAIIQHDNTYNYTQMTSDGPATCLLYV